ncbi:hypothetical protein CPT_Saba_045 [Proteus phage Saba]|uniref:Uncharacterized protein n=1 Tax=Proteus phage Saba TaxID=2596672 RepID=A0A5B9N5M7_9CAUD|nr:hypothetical protein JT320_gp45 [Proteus phage Saba]QEG09418.1 hypothetical protein CPT_Saba_045 [Proteus phage Saba]
MLQFMDGFDQLKDMPADTLVSMLNNSGYNVTPPVRITEGRDSEQRGLFIGDDNEKAASPGALKRVFTSETKRVVIGFAYCANKVRDDIVRIPGIGPLGWNRDTGKVSFAGVQGNAILLLGLWYYFEIVINKETNSFQVFINNGADIAGVLPESARFLTDYACEFPGGFGGKKIDDIVFIDAQAGKFTDRIGPIEIKTRMPTSDVVAEWSPSKGDNHSELVSNRPPVADEYIQSNASGAMDTFLAEEPVDGDGKVLAVSVTVINRKSDIDNRHLGLVVGEKGKQSEKVDEKLTLTNKISYAVFEQTPSGASWDRDNIPVTPFGVVIRP